MTQGAPDWAKQISKDIKTLTEDFKKDVNKRFDGMDGRLDRMDRRFDGMDRRLGRIEDDFGDLKGANLELYTVRSAAVIARMMDLEWVYTLIPDDLNQMVSKADTTGIAPSTLDSFMHADLIIRAKELTSGEPWYIAVETSFRIYERDVNRAVRNAKFLTRFTCENARAVVAGVHLNEGAKERVGIEPDKVFLYTIEAPTSETVME